MPSILHTVLRPLRPALTRLVAMAALLAPLPGLTPPAQAQSSPAQTLPQTQAQTRTMPGIESVALLPGWKTPDGQHVTALRIKLQKGWKTYWRSPGDAGIPPEFDWRGSGNLRGVRIDWPTPHVFHQSGMRSVGYKNELILPLTIAPGQTGAPVRLRGEVRMGICKDICAPVDFTLDATLDSSAAAPDPRIRTALANRPVTAAEAGVQRLTCTIRPGANGLRITAALHMPSAGGREEAVLEASDPEIWISEPSTRREGGTLWIEADMEHMEGGAFLLDRSSLRLTVLGRHRAVEVEGCTAQ